jgi:glycosyltransferase involved in cell wall biosynthesis
MEGLKEHETVKGIPVHRIKLKTKNWPKSSFFQLFKYLEFVFKVAFEYRKFNYFHCNDLDTLPIGALVKVFLNRKTKVVYDAHEYEIERNGMSTRGRKISKIVEKALIRKANAVITVSNGIADEYVRLYQIPKPVILFNCPYFYDVGKEDIFRKKFNIDSKTKIFLYQGILGINRGIEILLSTFSKLNAEQFAIVFMGYGHFEDEITKASKKHKNIYFHPAVDMEVLPRYTSSADFGFYLIVNDCLSYYLTIGNKLFEYFIAHVPVISYDLHDVSPIIEKNKIGLILKDQSEESLINLIENIEEYSKDIKTENFSVINKEYNWENQEKKLVKLYESL